MMRKLTFVENNAANWLAKHGCKVDGCNSTRRIQKGYCCTHYLRFKKYGDPLGGGTFRGEPLRWIDTVAMAHQGNECLTWPFGKDRHGYGDVAVGGKHKGAHRHICELVNGPAPTPQHEAGHSCGRGKQGCVSPHHLTWKTPVENQADRLVHGTHNRGSQHPLSKLTEDQARYIKSMRGKAPAAKLARETGVSPRTIAKIQQGARWGWL